MDLNMMLKYQEKIWELENLISGLSINKKELNYLKDMLNACRYDEILFRLHWLIIGANTVILQRKLVVVIPVAEQVCIMEMEEI